MSKLSYFMRKNDIHEIVSVPAPPSIVDENGNPVMMQIKKLTRREIVDIEEKTKRTYVYHDAKKRPVVTNGRVAVREEVDAEQRIALICVEALQYPDLKDKELMDFFGCYEHAKMLDLVFPDTEEYRYVTDQVYKVLGLIEDEDAAKKQRAEIDEAKN